MTNTSFEAIARERTQLARRGTYGYGSVTYDRGRNKFTATLAIGTRRVRRFRRTEAEAWDALEALHRDKAKFVANSQVFVPTVGEAIAHWLFEREAQGKITEKTLHLYGSLSRTRIEPVLGDLLITELDYTTIKSFFTKQAASGLARSTLSKLRTILSRAVGEADKEAGLTRVNPMLLLDELPGRIKAARAGESLSPTQVHAVIAAAADDSRWLECWVRLAIDCGMRPGEQAALCWSDFDLDARSVNVAKAIKRNPGGPTIGLTKTGQAGNRRPEFTSATAECLRLYRNIQRADRQMRGHLPDRQADVDLRDRVFLNARGRLLDESNLRTRFAKLARVAGVDRCTPYSLRTTCLSSLIERGVDPVKVSRIAGHTNLMSVARFYAKPTGCDDYLSGVYND